MLREMTLKEIQTAEMHILDAFAAYCEEHGYCYCLFAGTLLGAVKYKGFIPWDDDIDVAMPRADYDRFVAEYEDGRFLLKTPERDKGYLWQGAKLVDTQTVFEARDAYWQVQNGLCIDIFPLDNLGGSRAAAVFTAFLGWPARKMILLKRMQRADRREKWKNAVIAVSHVLLVPIPERMLIRWVYAVARMNRNRKKSAYVGDALLMQYGLRSIHKAEEFDAYEQTEFEGRMFPVPVRRYEILSRQYGEYTKDLPENKKVRPHPFAAFHIEED